MEIEQNQVQKRTVTDFEEAMEYSCGPKGYGKYQLYTFFSIVCGMVCGAFFLYSLNYFEMAPEYECQFVGSDVWQTCTSDDFCGSDTNVTDHKIDWSSDRSLHNWVEKLNMECATTDQIGYIGSSFFAGTFVGSFIFPPLGDIYGRKLIHMCGLTLYIFVLIAQWFNSSLDWTYVILVFGGISETGRYYVAYVYCIEMFPKRLQTAAGLSIFMVFGFAKVIINLQFWFLDKYWTTNLIIALVIALIGWVLVFFTMGESIPFNHSMKRYNLTRKQLMNMQKMNGVEIVEFTFQEELDGQMDGPDGTAYHKLDNSQYQSASFDEQAKALASGPQDEVQVTAGASNIKQLCTDYTYCKNLIIMAVIWSFGSFGFFLIPYYLVTEPGKVFEYLLASESSEIIGTILCFYMTSIMPLKRAIILFCWMSIVAAVSLTLLDPVDQETYYFIAVQITNLGVLCVFDLCYVIVNQLFPTELIATAYGVCNIFGRFITILAPSIAVLPNPIPMIILIIYGGICGLIGNFLVVLNKEIKH